MFYTVYCQFSSFCVVVQLLRVTLKMEICHTEHSYIIGKAGNNIRNVMKATGCHVHFPDCNRSMCADKSSQVYINIVISFNVFKLYFEIMSFPPHSSNIIPTYQHVTFLVLLICWQRFDWSFDHLITLVIAITSIILAAVKSSMVVFWCRLTQVVLEMAIKWVLLLSLWSRSHVTSSILVYLVLFIWELEWHDGILGKALDCMDCGFDSWPECCYVKL